MEKDNVQTICFVTMEIWPGTGGGIGRLISENSRLLSEKGGRPVFLLDVDDNTGNAFMAYAARHIPGARVYTVNELLLRAEELQAFGPVDIGSRAFRFYHYWRSYLIDLCLQYILTKEKITGIEFADYLGQGYIYLKMRPLRQQCLAIPAWVRLHGSAELWNTADGREKFTPGNLQLYDMERYCLSHSDYWVAPSEGVWSWYKQYYQLQKHCFISPPGFQRLGKGSEHPRRPVAGRPRRILFYGKLQHIKGPDLLIQAALKYLAHDDPRAEILLVGPDVPAADGCSTRTHLQALIPEKYQPNFIFKGKIDPRDLLQLAAACDLAVFPSRVETFCLAAHELNWIGIPLLVNNIPGLDFFNESNSLQFNGTVNDLYNKLRLFFKKPELTKKLKWQIPKDGIPVDRLYKELSAGKENDLKPGLSGNEPPVDIFITGSTLSDRTIESINNMNYHNWRAWHLGDQVSASTPAPVTGEGKIKPGRNILINRPGGGCTIDWKNLETQFCLFLPEWIRPRPEFLPLAVAVLMADPGLAGVTCFAAREKTLPGEETYIIPYDLNPWLIFIENCAGAVPALWRRDVMEKLSPGNLVEAGISWSFYCSLAEKGKKVAVLPRVLMDVQPPGPPPPAPVPPVQKFAGFMEKHAADLTHLWAQALAEARDVNNDLHRANLKLLNANTDLNFRVGELETVRDKLWREVQRLTEAWEEQRNYIHGQEKTCAELWNQLQNANQALQEARAELKECKQTMDQLLNYLEEKKIIKLMTASGLLDIKQFRRNKS